MTAWDMFATLARQSEPAQSAYRLPRLRVFVGVKVAPTIARQLAQFAAVLKRPFVRPVAPADIHLTLVPPWNGAFAAGGGRGCQSRNAKVAAETYGPTEATASR